MTTCDEERIELFELINRSHKSKKARNKIQLPSGKSPLSRRRLMAPIDQPLQRRPPNSALCLCLRRFGATQICFAQLNSKKKGPTFYGSKV